MDLNHTGNIYKVIDPLNNRVIVEIKNPRMKIKPIESSSSIINLSQILENFNGKVPDFGLLGEPLVFD